MDSKCLISRNVRSPDAQEFRYIYHNLVTSLDLLYFKSIFMYRLFKWSRLVVSVRIPVWKPDAVPVSEYVQDKFGFWKLIVLSGIAIESVVAPTSG